MKAECLRRIARQFEPYEPLHGIAAVIRHGETGTALDLLGDALRRHTAGALALTDEAVRLVAWTVRALLDEVMSELDLHEPIAGEFPKVCKCCDHTYLDYESFHRLDSAHGGSMMRMGRQCIELRQCECDTTLAVAVRELAS